MSDKMQPNAMIARSERRETGKALRTQSPRSSHGDWSPEPDRPDPISLLQAQDASRLQQDCGDPQVGRDAAAG